MTVLHVISSSGAKVWRGVFQLGVTGEIPRKGDLGQNYNQEMRKNITG